MPDEVSQTGRTKESILTELVDVLETMTQDWETDYDGGITRETKLIADLGFESIDVVQLVVAIEERFKRRGLPFERLLMADERYVDDLAVGEIVDFLFEAEGEGTPA